MAKKNAATQLGVAKAIAGTIPDLVGIPAAGVVGLGTMAAAALDMDPDTHPGEAFNAGLEEASQLWYDNITKNIMGLVGVPGSDFGDQEGELAYQYIGEAFDWTLSKSGELTARVLGRGISKPLHEALGVEWGPSNEAFWYAAGKSIPAAFMAALPFKKTSTNLVSPPSRRLSARRVSTRWSSKPRPLRTRATRSWSRHSLRSWVRLRATASGSRTRYLPIPSTSSTSAAWRTWTTHSTTSTKPRARRPGRMPGRP
jgi:hypothetical protein